MARSEQQIQEELVSRYLKNLEYFKKNDLELYKKIETLSTAINEKIYKERYALEYVKEIDDFDILELETKTYLYEKNIKEKNKEIYQSVSLSKNSTFSNLNKHIYKKYIHSYSLPNRKYELLDNYLAEDISEINDLFLDIKTSDTYKYIDKMFFLGVKLGSHINSALKKIIPKFSFIYEANLEIFRLSLFVTDYFDIASKTRVIYSVMDHENVFLQKLELFISQIAQFSNYNIKYVRLDNVTDDIVHKIVTKLHLANSTLFDYTKVLYDTVYSFSKHINSNNILSLKSLSKDYTIFDDKPVLFVGAGPSLSKNIDWLKKNQNKFIIVSMGATYKKLIDNDIKIDIVTTADQQYDVLNNTHFNEEDVKLLKNTIVIASISTPSKILKRFNKDKLFLFETYQAFKENSRAYNGASIGEVTLSILLDLNIKEIFLLGIDLALDEETGETHYSGYINRSKTLDKDLEVNSLFKDGVTTLKEEYLYIKGNTKEKIVTTRVFALSIAKYVELVAQFRKEGQTIFNLSKNSAYIQGIDYLDLKDLEIDDDFASEKNSNHLLENLKELSESGLTDLEIEKLNYRIRDIESLIVFIEKIYSNKFSKNIYDFNEKLESIFKAILDTKDYTCSNILANYLNFAIPFIYNSLNDEKIKSKVITKNMNEVEKILNKHIVRILEVYVFYLKGIKK